MIVGGQKKSNVTVIDSETSFIMVSYKGAGTSLAAYKKKSQLW